MKKLIEDHMPIVWHIVEGFRKKYTNYDAFDEMTSDGYLGLVQAARAFDESKGVKFSTYAYRRIVGEILNCIRHQSGTRRKHHATIQTAGYIGDIAVAENVHSRTDDSEHVETLLQVLTAKQRDVVRRHALCGQTQQSIADETGVTRAAVSLCYCTALEKIRKRFPDG